ncbi:hypothetical protein AG0111_0g4695 [Alternaria gaisen]|uniref:Uncharacterized protein n=1 Tax=Alternaria gaisen TaxID=167740 RepID=A0ACB6FT79_9PLEO|nr:hypothetical protein AG0111_0g4695 [Alternaria gaisen]
MHKATAITSITLRTQQPLATLSLGKTWARTRIMIMASKKSDLTDAGTNTNVNRNNIDSDETPPIYYDAEPSAQPPSYPNYQSTSPTELQKRPASRPKPTNQHSTGAPASTIAAVLGSEYTNVDAQRRADRRKKTFRERWNNFKERNLRAYDASEDRAGAAIAAEWNVQGGRLSGGLAAPY